MGGAGGCLTQRRGVGTFLPLLPFPFPSQERLGHGHRGRPVAAAASAPAGLGYGESDRFQGGAYCACAGSPKEGVGREGGGDVPGALGPGFERLEVRVKGWE